MRLMIFGRPGSGKSTFALMIHKGTGISLYHLDRYFYQEQWVERPQHDFLAIQEGFVTQEMWIIDGNNTKSLEMRFARATTCIYFNFGRGVCLWRILKRFVGFKNRKLQDRAALCRETINLKFLMYTWSFHVRVEPIVEHLTKAYPHVRFIEVRCDADAKKMYDELMRDAAQSSLFKKFHIAPNR